ncbi:hypothetical protein MPAR162_15135 [Methylorubrum populi]|uniref:Uncharacterized protein n=1 Tax=Methylobacterium radiotolerans TaxID=31998 RepID=A0ABU7T604_9HYPH
MKKSLLALAVLATFGLAGSASAAPLLPGGVSAPDAVVEVQHHHGRHHQHMRRHHHHHHMRHHHHRHHMRHHHHRRHHHHM